MNNYVEVTYNNDYNPKDLSAKASCYNMSVLSSKYMQYQNRLFEDKINLNDCRMHNSFYDNIENIKNDESDMMKGFSINKKSCIYKRPNYGEGDWVNQYQYSDLLADQYNSYKLFNFQSKAKTSKEPSVSCDYSKVFLTDECDKGPYFTYTNTFTSDYYNCVK